MDTLGGIECLIKEHVVGIVCLIMGQVGRYVVFNYGTRWEVCCVYN